MESESIIVADDHPVFRDGLCTLIQTLLPTARILPADTFEGALALARAANPTPSMFILDLVFARKSIRAELPALRQEFNRASIVVVSMADDRSTVEMVMSYGINGFINKSVPPTEIADALTAIRNGDIVIKVPTYESLAGDAGSALSDRQMEVLRFLAEGRTNKEIALALSLSPFTVRIHVSALFHALGVNTRSAAVAKAIAEGLIDPIH